MSKINLLPKTQQRRLFFQKFKKVLNFSFSMTLILILMAILGIFYLNWFFGEKERKLEKELASLIEANQAYSSLEKEILTKERKLSDIQKLKEGFSYRELMEKIASLIPPYCQIEKISFSEEILRISGNAQNRRQVAQFQQNLLSESQFLDANIESANLKEGKISFEITLKFKK